jgi:hypothetical protein
MTEEMNLESDDALLSAYIDGVLPADRCAALERRLRQEPELRQRLDRLERVNAAVRDAYAPDSDEPLPQSVLDLLTQTDSGAPARDVVVDLAARRARTMPPLPGWPQALAASFMLAIGIGLGYLISTGGAESDLALLAKAGVVEPGSPLHVVLENGASRSIQDIGTDLRAMPILSFEAQNGQYCRQIEFGGSAVAAEALACRGGGSWQLEALGFLPDRQFERNFGGFRPAGAASTAVEALIDQRIAGDPLDPASEQALIETGWIER